jgi:hypothetical protein
MKKVYQTVIASMKSRGKEKQLAMPAFLTHWRILIETARRSQDAGSDLGSLIIDTSALRRRISGQPVPPETPPAGAVWNTGPLPRIDYHFPGSDISAMAYLGALVPDITSFQKGHFKRKISDAPATPSRPNTPHEWETLFHTTRAGDLLLTLLEHIAELPSPAVRSQALAFCLGYLSHIAADIALNPWLNVLASKYSNKEIPGIFLPLGRHFYSELCLDEYTAITYFKHELYEWFNQPWHDYIEPAASNILTAADLTARILDLFIGAAEATYGLSEVQSQDLRHQYLAGLQRMRTYLAGRGNFRLLVFNAQARQRKADPIIASVALHRHQRGVTTSEAVIAYSIRLSERLCRRAISYYASLRNTTASAEERSQRRTTLRNDLRNWDLNTGYTLEVLFDQEITIRYLHNWIHFADLWDEDASETMHPEQTVIE